MKSCCYKTTSKFNARDYGRNTTRNSKKEMVSPRFLYPDKVLFILKSYPQTDSNLNNFEYFSE